MYLPYTDPTVKRILSGLDVKQSDVLIQEFCGPMNLDSYWDGGSIDQYALIDLRTFRRVELGDNHPYYDGSKRILSQLPEGFALVQYGYFCGHKSRARIYLNSANLVQFIPAPAAELSRAAVAALDVIGGIRSAYRAEEFSRAGIGRYAADNPAVKELLAAGLVKANKAGALAITTDGKNRRRR